MLMVQMTMSWPVKAAVKEGRVYSARTTFTDGSKVAFEVDRLRADTVKEFG